MTVFQPTAKELPPIREEKSDFERIEARIREAFKKLLYAPLLAELGYSRKTLLNTLDDLYKAISQGRITFSRGAFRGRFDAQSSKELKRLGAKWDPKTSTFKLPTSEQPPELRSAISTGEVRFNERIARIDKRLSKLNVEEISGSIKTQDLFLSTLEKTDRKLQKSLPVKTQPLSLPERDREKIAEEWQENLDLWINNFAEAEIKALRKNILKSVVAGDRYEAIAKTLQRSYGVTANKAKFLARQETGLLMAKFKEVRYTSLGINEYKWKTVVGTPNHPVRETHKKLDGKIFRWDAPPITSEDGRRNNPGQDYNCRCTAIPIVRFK
jgi:SPP1 gp7 family putative phage head morphogenesis protein